MESALHSWDPNNVSDKLVSEKPQEKCMFEYHWKHTINQIFTLITCDLPSIQDISCITKKFKIVGLDLDFGVYSCRDCHCLWQRTTKNSGRIFFVQLPYPWPCRNLVTHWWRKAVIFADYILSKNCLSNKPWIVKKKRRKQFYSKIYKEKETAQMNFHFLLQEKREKKNKIMTL